MTRKRIDPVRALFRQPSNGLPKMAAIILSAVLISAIAGCDMNPFGGPSGDPSPMKTTHAVDTQRLRLPPMDLAAPANTQTATFALG